MTYLEGQDQGRLGASKRARKPEAKGCRRPNSPLPWRPGQQAPGATVWQHEPIVDQRLCPAHQTQPHEYLRLDLDGQVEVLHHGVRAERDAA